MTMIASTVAHSDNVTDAAQRLGLTVPKFFLKAARGWTNREDVAENWYRIWSERGYRALPPSVRTYILHVLEGQDP